jgi:hypothetical protein
MAKNSVLDVLSVPSALPTEYRILNQAGIMPAQDSQKYIQFVEADAGMAVFNPASEDAAAIETKSITISGMTVVLENSSAQPLFVRVNGRTNLRFLNIAADEVIIRSPLIVPGATVTIHARSLRFEKTGLINTTPPSIDTRSTKAVALKGAPAGSIYLYVKTLEVSGSDKRLIANGGNGQPAQLGEKGVDGKNLTPWNGKATTKTGLDVSADFDWTDDMRGKTNGFTVVHASIWCWFSENGRSTKNDRADFFEGDFPPGNGQPPKRMPGTPGGGGAGGDVYSRFQDLLTPRTEQKAGQSGEKAVLVAASLAGTPVKSCSVYAYYEKGTIWNSKKSGTEFEMNQTHESYGHAAVPAPEAPTAEPAGRQKPLGRTDDAVWLHPLNLQAFTSYLRDAYRAGQASSLRGRAGEYVATLAALDAVLAKAASSGPDFVAGASQLPIEFMPIEAELRALVAQIDSPFDYFGYPAGWTPVLSFESNYSAFETETRDAMARLYLAYWIEHNQASAEARANTIKTTLEQVKKETDAAIKAYNDGNTELVTVDQDYDALRARIDHVIRDAMAIEADVERYAKGDLEREKFFRAAGKLLGGIAQMIPVGQPALAAVGKGLTALADFDADQPWGSVKKIGAELWDTKLVQDKLMPKVKAGAKKLLELKSDENEEKDDFSKEVEKKELGNKVKKHIKEQTEAKEQMTKALGAFAVSEDEVEAAVEKALAKCPEYTKLKKDLDKLNKDKAEFAVKLLGIVRRLDEASTIVVNNRLTEIELRGALSTTAKNLTPEGLRYTRAMGLRALERLQRYEYYFVKSYLYLWLETLPNFDTNSEYIFKKLQEVVQPKSEAILSGEQFKALGTVFRENLKTVADRLLTYYNTTVPSQTATKSKFTLELSDKHLAALNGPGKSAVVDPMAEGKLHLSLENVRIYDIQVVDAKLINPPPSAVDVRLRMKHGDESTLRRNGKLYLFRNTERRWGTTVSSVGERITLSADTPDPMDDSLIRTLLGLTTAPETLRSRPSAWSSLVIERELMDMVSDYAATFSAVTIEVQYTAQDVDPNHVSVFVSVPSPLEPEIKCSQKDLNEHDHGAGRFMRTYHKATGSVTLTAPADYGDHVFLGWRSRGLKSGSEPTNLMPLLAADVAAKDLPKDLVRERTITLTLDTHRLVEAVFQQRIVRQENRGDPATWPRGGPEGWEFHDWLLVNESEKEEFKIAKVDYMPWRGGDSGYGAEAQTVIGNSMVKLALEKLAVAPGASMKFSVFANPQVSATGNGTQLQLGSTTGYSALFSGRGEIIDLGKSENVWKPAGPAFHVDSKARVLRFLGKDVKK